MANFKWQGGDVTVTNIGATDKIQLAGSAHSRAPMQIYAFNDASTRRLAGGGDGGSLPNLKWYDTNGAYVAAEGSETALTSVASTEVTLKIKYWDAFSTQTRNARFDAYGSTTASAPGGGNLDLFAFELTDTDWSFLNYASATTIIGTTAVASTISAARINAIGDDLRFSTGNYTADAEHMGTSLTLDSGSSQYAQHSKTEYCGTSLTLNGTTQYAEKEWTVDAGTSLTLASASSQYVDAGTGDEIQVASDDVMWSIWFKTSTTGVEQGLMNGDNADAFLRIKSDNNLEYRGGYDGSIAPNVIDSTATYNDGNWHHVVGLFDRTNNPACYLFVDGKYTASASDGSSFTTCNVFTSFVRLGVRDGNYFNGNIDKARFFRFGQDGLSVSGTPDSNLVIRVGDSGGPAIYDETVIDADSPVGLIVDMFENPDTSLTNLGYSSLDDADRTEMITTQTDRDFETSIGNWTASGTNTVAQSAAQAHGGSNSMLCTYQDNTTMGNLASFTNPTAGVVYRVSAWVYIPSGNWTGGGIYTRFLGYSSASFDEVYNTETTTDSWVQLNGFIMADSGDTSGSIIIKAASAPSAGDYIYIDDVSITRIGLVGEWDFDSLGTLDGTAEYTSDFSAGVDSWAVNANGTLAGNIDSIGGQNDNLRFTVNSTSGEHSFKRAMGLEVGKYAMISFDYYMPSTNSHMDGFAIRDYAGANNEYTVFTAGSPDESTVTDTWTTVDFVWLSTDQGLFFRMYDGSSSSWQDASGDDVFYIRNMSIYNYIPDNTSNELTLTPSGTPTTTDSNLPVYGELDFGTRDFGFSCWFKTSTTAHDTLFSKYDGSTDPYFELDVLGDGTDLVQLYLRDTGDNLANGALTTTTVTGNVWHHLTVICDKSGNAYGFLNGKYEASFAISSVGSIKHGLSRFRIGRTSTVYFNGNIDKARIFNFGEGGLSVSGTGGSNLVIRIGDSDGTPIFDETIIDSDNPVGLVVDMFENPSSSLTDIGYSKLDNVDRTELVDNGEFDTDITGWTVTQGTGQTAAISHSTDNSITSNSLNLSVTVAGSQSIRPHINNLANETIGVGFYELKFKTKLVSGANTLTYLFIGNTGIDIDNVVLSGTQVHSYLVNVLTAGTAIYIYFNNQVAEIQVDDVSLKPIGLVAEYDFDNLGTLDGVAEYSSDFSAGVDGWTQHNEVTVAGNIDGIGTAPDIRNDCLRVTMTTNNGTHIVKRATPTLTIGRWYTLSFDYYIPSSNSDMDGMRLYNSAGTVAYSNWLEETDAWTSVTVSFQASIYNTGFWFYFGDGQVLDFADAGADDVAYFRNVELIHYVVDNTDNEINLVPVNTPTTTASEIPVYSDFDFGKDDFMVSAWFKVSSVSANAAILSKAEFDNIGDFELYINQGNSQLTTYMHDGSGNVSVSTGQDNVDGYWHHGSYVADRSGNGYMFIDGVYVNSGDISARSNSISYFLSNFKIGTASSEYWNGEIDKVRIFRFGENSLSVSGTGASNLVIEIGASGSETTIYDETTIDSDNPTGLIPDMYKSPYESLTNLGYTDLDNADRSEKVTNGNMELDSNWSDWNAVNTNEQSSTIVKKGSFSRHVETDAVGEGIYTQPSLSFVADKKYFFSGWVYVVSGGEIRATDQTGTMDLDQSTSTTGQWERLTQVISPTTTGGKDIFFEQSGAASEFYVDDVSVKRIGCIAEYDFNQLGTMDNSDLVTGGVDMTDAHWSDRNTPETNEQTDHDGRLNVRHVNDSTASNGGFETNDSFHLSLTAGVRYVYSFDIKVVSGTAHVKFRSEGGGGDSFYDEGTHTDSSWTNYTGDFLCETTASDYEWEFYNASAVATAEFYVDNVSVKALIPDSHDNELHLTPVNTPTTSTNYLVSPKSRELLIPQTLTIESWVKPNWNGNDGANHYIYDNDQSTNQIQLYKGAGDTLITRVRTPDKNITTNEDISAWTAGAWHHVVMVVDRNTIDGTDYIWLYIDGVEVANSTTRLGNAENNQSVFDVGHDNVTGNFDGILHLRVYNFAIPTTEANATTAGLPVEYSIENRYNSGAGSSMEDCGLNEHILFELINE